MRVAALLLQCSEDAEAVCYAVHITWLTAIFTVHELNDGYRLSKGTMSAGCTGIFMCVCIRTGIFMCVYPYRYIYVCVYPTCSVSQYVRVCTL